MPKFAVNKDVVTETPTVEVSLSAAAPLPPGLHIFRLTVVDDQGAQSSAAEIAITVASAPVAQLVATDAAGNKIDKVPYAQSFMLDGRMSDGCGATIKQYVWTYLGPKG
jgi:hypothetical protein